MKDGEDVVEAATALADRNGFIVADLPADDLLKAADALRDRGTALKTAGSIDDRAREQDCRANVVHAPTRSMLADALAQYLVWKQWKRWLLVTARTTTTALADALAARRHASAPRSSRSAPLRIPAAHAVRQRRHLDPAADAGFHAAGPGL